MKCAIEMGSGAMIYITGFIKIGSGIPKLKREGDSQTHRHHGDDISLLSFFQNKESRLKEVKKGPDVPIKDQSKHKMIQMGRRYLLSNIHLKLIYQGCLMNAFSFCFVIVYK
jgi:hypothetical protein